MKIRKIIIAGILFLYYIFCKENKKTSNGHNKCLHDKSPASTRNVKVIYKMVKSNCMFILQNHKFCV